MRIDVNVRHRQNDGAQDSGEFVGAFFVQSNVLLVDEVSNLAESYLDNVARSDAKITITVLQVSPWRRLRHGVGTWRLPMTSLTCRSGNRSRAVGRNDVRVLAANVVEMCVLVE